MTQNTSTEENKGNEEWVIRTTKPSLQDRVAVAHAGSAGLQRMIGIREMLGPIEKLADGRPRLSQMRAACYFVETA